MPNPIRTVVHGKPLGNLGNQMLQYMLLMALSKRSEGIVLSGIELPTWKISIPKLQPLTSGRVILQGQYVDADFLTQLSAKGTLPELEFAAYGFQMKNYLPRDDYRAVFPTTGGPTVERISESLIINVRGAEILGNEHPDYGPVPIDFFRFLCRQTGLSPIFMGQLGTDWYSATLRREFPSATFITSFGVEGDFAVMRAARHIVMSVSTFSWLACWLSEAQTIHLPALGFLNPMQRPDVSLLPLNDPRYKIYSFPVRKWFGSSTDIDEVHSPYLGHLMGAAECKQMVSEAATNISVRVRRYRRRLRWRAFLSSRLGIGGPAEFV